MFLLVNMHIEKGEIVFCYRLVKMPTNNAINYSEHLLFGNDNTIDWH